MADPYRVWQLYMPFTKEDFPVRGNFGSKILPVVVIETETFRRMINDHESLKDTKFELIQKEE